MVVYHSHSFVLEHEPNFFENWSFPQPQFKFVLIFRAESSNTEIHIYLS